MTSILFTTGPIDEVRAAASRLVDVAHDVEDDSSFAGFDVAVDLFADTDSEKLARTLEATLQRPVRTLEFLDR